MPHRHYSIRSSCTPFPGATDLHARLAASFALITDWSAALNGTYEMDAVLLGLAQRMRASSIAVYRMKPDANRPRAVARAMLRQDIDIAPLPTGSLAEVLLQRHGGSALPGSVWRLTELRDDPYFDQTRAAEEWARRPQVCEVTLVILANALGNLDVLEFQFESVPPRHEIVRPELVAKALADAWDLRQDGLVARLVAAQTRRNRRGSVDARPAILAPENPYGLSRCEYRICGLVGLGLKAPGIAAELDVSISTIRTHLRNIYAKTEASGQVDVMSRLYDVSASENAAPNLRQAANA